MVCFLRTSLSAPSIAVWASVLCSIPYAIFVLDFFSRTNVLTWIQLYSAYHTVHSDQRISLHLACTWMLLRPPTTAMSLLLNPTASDNYDVMHGRAVEDLTFLPFFGSGSFVSSVLRSTHRVFNQAFSMKLFSNGLCKSVDSLTDAIKALFFSNSSKAYQSRRRPSHKRRYWTVKPPTQVQRWGQWSRGSG